MKMLCSVATAEDRPSSLRSERGVEIRVSEASGLGREPRGLMVSQPVPCLPVTPTGEVRPPWPFSSHGGHQEPLGLRAKLGVGCSPNWPACRSPSRGNSRWLQPRKTGNAMEGYLSSNYYFEKGGKKAEGETFPPQIICSLGGWEGVPWKTF